MAGQTSIRKLKAALTGQREYTYERLKSPQHIRVLQVTKNKFLSSELFSMQAAYSFDVIQIELPWSLESGDTRPEPNYECISYHWGNQSKSEKLWLRNGQRFIRVTKTLLEAIPYLCEETTANRLWIDQICINQADVDERGHQVRRMGTIYSRAKKTIIWLGPSIKHLARFLRIWMTEINLRPERIPFKALQALFQRQWFRRGWVVQEYVLSNHCIFLAGSVRITHLDELVVFCAGDYSNGWSSWTDQQGALNFLTMSRVKRSSVFADRESIQDDFHILQVCGQSFDTTEQHDRIYAYLGLLGHVSFVPDYSRTYTDALTHFALSVVRKTSSTAILSYAAGSCRAVLGLQSLPSWVPAWTWPADGKVIFTGHWWSNDQWSSSLGGAQYALSGASMFRWNSDSSRTHACTEPPRTNAQMLVVHGKVVDHIEYATDKIHTGWVRGGWVRSGWVSGGELIWDSQHGAPENLIAESLNTIWKCRRKFLGSANPLIVSKDDTQISIFGVREARCRSRGVPLSEIHEGLESLQEAYFFQTRQGRFGIATKPCQPGNLVTIIHGCHLPMILCPASEPGHHEVFSGSFIDGIMHGEAVTWAEEDADQFILV